MCIHWMILESENCHGLTSPVSSIVVVEFVEGVEAEELTSRGSAQLLVRKLWAAAGTPQTTQCAAVSVLLRTVPAPGPPHPHFVEPNFASPNPTSSAILQHQPPDIVHISIHWSRIETRPPIHLFPTLESSPAISPWTGTRARAKICSVSRWPSRHLILGSPSASHQAQCARLAWLASLCSLGHAHCISSTRPGTYALRTLQYHPLTPPRQKKPPRRPAHHRLPRPGKAGHRPRRQHRHHRPDRLHQHGHRDPDERHGESDVLPPTFHPSP